MQSEAKVHVTGNVYRHNPNTRYIGKTHLISQRLSLNMPRLNQNRRIQALTMLARGDNVSNVSRAFSCHRNTEGYKPSNGQVHYADAPSTSFSNGDKFCKALRYQQTDSVALPQASPATHSAKEALCGTSAFSTSSGWLPVCGGHNGISVGFYSLMSLGLTLVIMTVEFAFLEEGSFLPIIVSLRGTDLEVGVLWYGVALWAEGK